MVLGKTDGKTVFRKITNKPTVQILAKTLVGKAEDLCAVGGKYTAKESTQPGPRNDVRGLILPLVPYPLCPSTSQAILTAPSKSTAATIPDQPSSPPNPVFPLQQLPLSDTSKKGVRKRVVADYRITCPQGKFLPNPWPSVSGCAVP